MIKKHFHSLLLICMIFSSFNLSASLYLYENTTDTIPDKVYIADTDSVVIRNSKITFNDDIYVFQGGTLIFDTDSLILNGNMYTWDSGLVSLNNTDLLWNTQYIYHYNFIVAGGATMLLDSVHLVIPVSAGMSVTDSATFTATNTHIEGVWTKSAERRAVVTFTDCIHPFECLVSDSAKYTFTRCTEVLMWLNFPDGTSGNINIPGAATYQPVDSFYLGPLSTNVTGIKYEVIMDSTTNIWGAFPQQGCNITFNDSYFVAMGFVLNDSGTTYNIKHLYNKLLAVDQTLALPDRTVRLVNTYVNAFNVYPMLNTILNLDSCQLGEVIAYHDTHVNMHQVVFDGTGGFFGTEHNSVVKATECNFSCGIKISGTSKLIADYSHCPFTTTIIDKGQFLASNTTTSATISVQDSAHFVSVNFDNINNYDTLNSPQQVLSDIITINGTHTDTMHLEALLYYINLSDTTTALLVPLSPLGYNEQIDHSWNTDMVNEGSIYLIMPVITEYGDTLNGFRLVTKVIGAPTQIETVQSEKTLRVYPNPFTSKAHILLPEGCSTVAIYDLQGRSIKQWNISGEKEIVWNTDNTSVPAGLYVVRCMTETGIEKRLMIKK